MILNEKPFVSADEAARFLGIMRRFLLSLASKGVSLERMRLVQAVFAEYGYFAFLTLRSPSTRSGII
jgi:hypothetical protein